MMRMNTLQAWGPQVGNPLTSLDGSGLFALLLFRRHPSEQAPWRFSASPNSSAFPLPSPVITSPALDQREWDGKPRRGGWWKAQQPIGLRAVPGTTQRRMSASGDMDLQAVTPTSSHVRKNHTGRLAANDSLPCMTLAPGKAPAGRANGVYPDVHLCVGS